MPRYNPFLTRHKLATVTHVSDHSQIRLCFMGGRGWPLKTMEYNVTVRYAMWYKLRGTHLANDERAGYFIYSIYTQSFSSTETQSGIHNSPLLHVILTKILRQVRLSVYDWTHSKSFQDRVKIQIWTSLVQHSNHYTTPHHGFKCRVNPFLLIQSFCQLPFHKV